MYNDSGSATKLVRCNEISLGFAPVRVQSPSNHTTRVVLEVMQTSSAATQSYTRHVLGGSFDICKAPNNC